MKGVTCVHMFLSVTDEQALQKVRMLARTKNSARQKLVKSADKITENHADFIIEVMWDSIRKFRTLLESV